jgi:uncharacterized membrane protein
VIRRTALEIAGQRGDTAATFTPFEGNQMAHSTSGKDFLQRFAFGVAITALIIGVANMLPPTGKPSIPAWALATHLTSAVISLGLGAWVLSNPTGTPRHKMAGKIWVVLMLTASFSSLFIQAWGRFSPIHIFSVWTPISIGMGIFHARKGNIKKHQGSMKGAYFGLIAAGLFAAFMPGRFLWRAIFG